MQGKEQQKEHFTVEINSLDEETKQEVDKRINNPVLVCQEIYLKTLQLGKARRLLKEQSEKKARAIKEYNRQRALKIIELRNGKEVEWEGKKISNLPQNLVKTIAEGIVSDYQFVMELEKNKYDFIKVSCDSLQAEMNGLQSINKYIDELPGGGSK